MMLIFLLENVVMLTVLLQRCSVYLNMVSVSFIFTKELCNRQSTMHTQIKNYSIRVSVDGRDSSVLLLLANLRKRTVSEFAITLTVRKAVVVLIRP